MLHGPRYLVIPHSTVQKITITQISIAIYIRMDSNLVLYHHIKTGIQRVYKYEPFHQKLLLCTSRWGSRQTVHSFITSALGRWKWLTSCTALYPRGNSHQHPLDRWLGGPLRHSIHTGVEKNLLPVPELNSNSCHPAHSHKHHSLQFYLGMQTKLYEYMHTLNMMRQ